MAAILISLGNIIRPEGIVIVFSFLVFKLILLKKDNILDTIKKVVVFLTIYFVIGSTSSVIVQKLNINPIGLKNTNTMWKFVVGFNYDSCGYYSQEDEKIINNKALEKQVIIERIKSKNMPKLMVCKIQHFWLFPEDMSKSETLNEKTFNLFGHIFKYSTIEDIALKYNNYIYFITLFMCFIGVIFNRQKIVEDNSLFFVILLITTFFVYLLIEINFKYIYFILISIFILSSYGYDYCIEKIKKNNIT